MAQQGLERIPYAVGPDFRMEPVRARFPEQSESAVSLVPDSFIPDAAPQVQPAAAPKMSGADTLSLIGRNVWDAVVYHTPAAIAAAIEGDEPYKTTDWKDSLIERSRLRSQETAGKGPDAPSAIPGVSRADINSLGPSLGFSAVGAGAGLGAGVPAAIAGNVVAPGVGTVAGYGAGMLASGKAAFNMATNSFVRDLHDAANEESLKATGKPIKPEDFAAKQSALSDVIRSYGLWEAVPEAAGNALSFGILTAPVKGAIGKLFGSNIATRLASKMGALYGEELATETVTQTGQHNAEVAAGLTKAPERSFTSPQDLADSFKEVAPSTILQTTLMAGGFKAGQMGIERLRGRKSEEGGSGAPESGGPQPIEGTFIPADRGGPPAGPDATGGATYTQEQAPKAFARPALPAPSPLDGDVLGPQALPAGQAMLPPGSIDSTATEIKDAAPAPTLRQQALSRGLLTHSKAPSPDMLKRLMRVDDGMAQRLYDEWAAAQVGPQQKISPTDGGQDGQGQEAAQEVSAADDDLTIPFPKSLERMTPGNRSLYKVDEIIASLPRLRTNLVISDTPDQRGVAYTPEKAIRQLLAHRDNISDQDGKLRSGNRTGATTGTLLKNIKHYHSTANDIRASRQENPQMWADYAARQAEVQKLNVGDAVLAPYGGPEDPFGAPAVIVKKNPKNWRIRYTTGVKSELMVEPAALRPAPKVGAGATAIDAAAHQAATSPFNQRPQPTDAQKKAGNYAKGHVRFHGMDISIENPAGSVRAGKDEDGKAWETTMQHHYGYIKGTVGRDKDHLDVFIKPGAQSARTAYVIDQTNPKTGAFDEHKIVLGADSEQDARAIYQSNYQPGWNGLGAITAMPIDEFKAWIDSGKTKKPIAYVEPKGIAHPKPSAKPEAPAVIDPAAPYGKVGIAPFSSQVVGLKDNGDGTATVMRGEEPFYDFENGDPITVPTDATAERIRQAVTDAGALSSRDKWFGVAKIGTKPAETGTGLDKSVTEPTKPPEQDPAADVDFLASIRAEFRHEGFRIYPVSIMGEALWAVQSLDNAEKEQKGERQIGGDAIVDTAEQAKKQAEDQVTERAEKAERQREFAKQDAADEAKREANRGLSITERRANAALDKPTNLPVNAGVGRGSRREAMESAVSQGRAIVAADVPDTAAYKRDEDEQGRLHRAGYGAFFGNDSHPQKMRFNELTAKLKNRDNYQKKEYRLYNGRDTDGGFYEITKTEYDYAKSLMTDSSNAKPVAAIAGKPVADMPVEQLQKIASGESKTFGSAAVEKASAELARRDEADSPKATKEPWQYGELEYGDKYIDETVLPDLRKQLANAHGGKFQEYPSKAAAVRGLKERIDTLENHRDAKARKYYASLDNHYGAVRAALADGKPVPPVAYESYDDLKGDVSAGRIKGDGQEVARVETPQHIEAGQAEPATAPVIAASIKESATNTPMNIEQAREWLLSEIDKAIIDAKSAKEEGIWNRADDKVNLEGIMDVGATIGFKTFNVPGDGKFRVLNLKESLQKFKKQVAATPGFKKNATRPMSLANGSGGKTSVRDMLDDGEYQLAVEYGKLIGKPLLFGITTNGGTPVVYTDASEVEAGGFNLRVGREWTQSGKANGWAVIELSTGLRAAFGETEVKAVRKVENAIEQFGTEGLRDQIGKADKVSQAELERQFTDWGSEEEARAQKQRDALERVDTEDRALWNSIWPLKDGEKRSPNPWNDIDHLQVAILAKDADKAGKGDEFVSLIERRRGGTNNVLALAARKALAEAAPKAKVAKGVIQTGVASKILGDIYQRAAYNKWTWDRLKSYLTREMEEAGVAKSRMANALEKAMTEYARTANGRLGYPNSNLVFSAMRDYGLIAEDAPDAKQESSGDYKGFERTPTGNGSFTLKDGNLLVKVEAMGQGKFQASHGSAKSSPHINSEQGAVDWAANLRDASRKTTAYPFYSNNKLYNAEGTAELPKNWTGVARSDSGKRFFYLGQENGERSFNPLKAENYEDALKEADGLKNDKPVVPEGYREVARGYFGGTVERPIYAPFAEGDRVRFIGGHAGNIQSFIGGPVTTGAIIKYDNGLTGRAEWRDVEAVKKPSAEQEPKNFKSIDTLNAANNPLGEDDWIRFADGSEWQVKGRMNGWALVQGKTEHPTVKNIMGQVPFIRAVVDANDAAQATKGAEDTALTVKYGGSELDIDLGKPAYQVSINDVEAAVRAKGYSADTNPRTKFDPMQMWRNAHATAVAKAAKDGKPIPARVLYDYRGLIRNDLNDELADLAADKMVEVFRDTKDYEKAVQAYRDFGQSSKTALPASIADDSPDAKAVDYKGFRRVEGDGGTFYLEDGNMRVKVEPQGSGKFQASFRGAKSSPHIQGEQGAVDWAANYRGDGQTEGNTEDAGVDKASDPIEIHADLMARLREGTATLNEFKAGFAAVVDGKTVITESLSKLTKDAIFERFPGLAYRYKNDKKAEVIDAAYRSMLDSFAYVGNDGIQWTHGQKYEDVIRGYVDRTTEESLRTFAADAKAAKEDRDARQREAEAGMENPVTLDDYKRILAAKAREIGEGATFAQARMAMTPEQRARFDELAGEASREQRQARADQQRTEVRVAAQTTDGQIVETKHTKTGEPLFVVKAADRVEREVYNQWNAQAKKLGGWYSSYRGGGAVPGFQFKTRENADAFLKYLGGDVAPAKEAMQARRDAFADDRTQSAAERLEEMAAGLDERADESLSVERKANTERRARMAAGAEAAAQQNKAMARTMRNIADKLRNGSAKFLDRVRQKVQVEMLDGFVTTAKGKELRAKYPSYAEQEKHRFEPATAEAADYAEFPSYTFFRSDLASLGRQMLEQDGTKKLGAAVMRIADDVSAAYTKFAKENFLKVALAKSGGGLAAFPSRDAAEAAIRHSGFKGKAIVLPIKRGENAVVMSPSEASERGIWTGDPDKRLTLPAELGDEVAAKTKELGRLRIAVPWMFERTAEQRKRLKAIGIETPAEFRAALREFIAAKSNVEPPSRIKELERKMIGRKNDGLDFFPTPAGVAQRMVESADIQEGMAVLEPSAGMGHIAEAIREAGIDPDVMELSGDRRQLLDAKGFNVIGSDFMDLSPRGYTYGDVFRHKDGRLGVMRGTGGMGSNRVGFVPEGSETREWVDREDLTGEKKAGANSGYDRILMNPPFSERRDAEHVQHAYTLLRPGGRIVAIMGEGVFFGQDKKAQAFRDWLDKIGGTSEKLEDGTFLDPSLPVNTGVNARLVVIDKPSDKGVALESRASEARTAESRLNRTIPSAKPEAITQAKSIVAKFIEQYKRAADLDIRVVESADDIPAKYRPSPNAEGVYHSDIGAIWLVTDNLMRGGRLNASRTFQVLLHEAVGHHGLAAMMGDKFKSLKARVLATAKAKGTVVDDYYKPGDADYATVEAVRLRYPDATDDQVADEVLARMAETDPGRTLFGYVRAVVRQWLRDVARKIGVQLDTTVAELNDLVALASGYMRRGTGMSGERAPGGVAAASQAVQKQYRSVDTESAAFKRWFGDSKVVDAEGKPLVVYHGTSSDFDQFQKGDGGTFGDGIYFSMDRSDVDAYADLGEGSRVLPVFVKILNPANEDIASEIESKFGGRTSRELQRLGYDGVITETEVVAFHPEQIKSAISNVGTFSDSPSILESRARPGANEAIWDAPDPTTADNVIYTLQDKHIDLKRVQAAIKESIGKELPDQIDPYLQEELFHGRAAKATEEFLDRELQPLIGEMKQRGITMDSLETYLWARHAGERNAQIAKINPDMPDGGSGLTDRQARDVLAGKDVTVGGQTVKGIEPAKLRGHAELARKIDMMVAGNRLLLELYELETPSTLAAWKGAYQHYVPLHREDVDSPWAGQGTGQGYSVRGASTKRATGSYRPVENILANLVMQRKRIITRGEKNRVAQALYGLATVMENRDFWKVDDVPKTRVPKEMAIYHVMDGDTEVANYTRMSEADKHAAKIPGGYVYQSWGERVVEQDDPMFRSRPNVVWARFGGEDRFVIFNERDERAMRLAGALKNLDADDISHFLGEVSRWTRYFASINTQYNPVFGVVNLTRDTGTGLINLQSTPLKGKQAEMLGHVWQALPAIYRAIRIDREGGTPTGTWAELWEEFQEVGGQTGYRDMFRNATEQRDALEAALDPKWWQRKTWGKVISAGGLLAPAEQALLEKAGKPVLDWLSDYNTTMENAIRLSAYKVARDHGMSRERAASLAKNLTVNFNRKGQAARQLGALYAFFNASVQGTARMLETLTHGRQPGKALGRAGKQIVYGGLLLGSMQAMWLAAAGFDDDEPPEFVRDRAIIIPYVPAPIAGAAAGTIPGALFGPVGIAVGATIGAAIGEVFRTKDGKPYAAVPLPLGFHVLPALGRIGTEQVLNGFKAPGRAAFHVLDVMADAFNPIGNAGMSMQTLAPTVLDPAAALAENKDWTGKKIYRENFSQLDPKPGHQRTKDTATALSKWLSQALNSLTGGTEFQPGGLSPTPDQIDYLIGQVTGGVGREISKLAQTGGTMATGEELPAYKIPLIGRFYGDAKGQAAVSSRFYENLKAMNMHQAEFMGLAKSDRGEQAKAYLEGHPEASMFREADRMQRYVGKLQDEKRKAIADRMPSAKVKEIDAKITEAMQGFNARVAARRMPAVPAQ